MKTLAEAIALYQEERYLDASRRLALVTQFEPENVEGWMYFGAALAKLGRWPQAVEALRRVVKLRPDQVSGYCELAAALIETGDKSSAHAVLDQAASLDPAHPGLRGLRARLTGHAVPPEPAPDSVPSAPAGRRPRRAWRRRQLITDQNRLPLMLGVLVTLLVITVARSLIGRSSGPTQLSQAAALLARADSEAKALSRHPGEDFDVDQKVNQLVREAESLALAAQRGQPDSPRVYAVLARVALHQREPRRAWDHAQHGLDLLAAAPSPDPKLRAQLLLARAWAHLGSSAAAAGLARARADAEEAARLDPGAVDPALDKRLAEGR